MENKHKQYITAFVLHNSYTRRDGSLFSDLLFWLPHQINSVNNSHHDCGGGCLVRTACHVAMEPQSSVCSKNGNVYYAPVEYDFIWHGNHALIMVFPACWCQTFLLSKMKKSVYSLHDWRSCDILHHYVRITATLITYVFYMLRDAHLSLLLIFFLCL